MVTRNRILFVLGVWIVLIPFLGFPSSYKSFFIIGSGVVVVILAFLYARDKRLEQIRAEEAQEHRIETDSYAQSRPMAPDQNPGQNEEEKYTNIKEIRERSKAART